MNCCCHKKSLISHMISDNDDPSITMLTERAVEVQCAANLCPHEGLPRVPLSVGWRGVETPAACQGLWERQI